MEVFHPWVRWEGPGSGFENSSGGSVWKSRIGPPWDLGRKTGFSNGLADNRSKVSVKNLKSGSSLLTFRDLGCHICQIILWMAESGDLDLGSCSQIWIFSNTICFGGILKHGTLIFFQNLKFSKFHVPAIQKMLILS